MNSQTTRTAAQQMTARSTSMTAAGGLRRHSINRTKVRREDIPRIAARLRGF